MPRVARPQTGAFNFGISSGVEHKDNPGMKAIYLTTKSGPEVWSRGKSRGKARMGTRYR
jgi:hypothetical protein